MIQGRLEGLLFEDFVAGWACDTAAPERIVTVEARASDGETVAVGLAHLYRADLAAAGRGLGWCAFQLRLARPAKPIAKAGLVLVDRASGRRLDVCGELPLVEGEAATADPFTLGSVEALKGCAALLDACLAAVGPRAFTRLAYVYVLDRAADPESLSIHAALLESGALTPLQLLTLLAESGEFRREPRRLAGPKSPGFPFAEAFRV